MIQPTNAYPQGGANAVAINIFNPQAYGSQPMPNMQMQAQPQYAQITNPLYQMPYAPIYQPMQPNQAQAFYQPYLPMQNPMQTNVNQAVIAPAPQMMPESVMQATPAPAAVPAAETPAAPQAVETPAQEQAPATPAIDTNALVAGLKSADAAVKAKAINQIAAHVQDVPEVALQVVSEPVMQALVGVINEDTTKLEGPSAQQIDIAAKINRGETLTPEEDAIANKLSPRDEANSNRIFALYTLAMIQKLQRDELNQYIETQKANGQQTIAPLKMEELIGYNDVVNVINNDTRPEVKVAAIQALQHVAAPEDKATVQNVLANSLKSPDEAIKTAATEALANVQNKVA